MTATEIIARYLRPGCRVAIADGSGAPIGLSGPLTDAAQQVGGVQLLVGWCFAPPVDLANEVAFPDIRTVMGGYALRKSIAAGRVHYLPARISAIPALLAGPLRPDVVVLALRPGERGWAFGSEISWMRAAIDSGATVLAEINHGLPRSSGDDEVPIDEAIVVSEVDRRPHVLPPAAVDDDAVAIGHLIAGYIPDGATIQFGPGKIGEAAIAAVDVSVNVDSGVVSDPVVDLDVRGLLLGEPTATYLVGSERLYDWADGRPILHRIEQTHDMSRLMAQPLVAINTALEIDAFGSVNVEKVGGQTLAGIGGHGDYATAASRAPQGLSIIALPTSRAGQRTLVDTLSAPVSTSYADVDVVITERGAADVRGLDPQERAAAICSLWPA